MLTNATLIIRPEKSMSDELLSIQYVSLTLVRDFSFYKVAWFKIEDLNKYVKNGHVKTYNEWWIEIFQIKVILLDREKICLP